jgi:hypothetical protein
VEPTANSRSGEGDQLLQQPQLSSVETLNQAIKSLRSNYSTYGIKTKVERPSCNETTAHLGLSQCYAIAPKMTQELARYHPTINQSYSLKGLPLSAYESTSQRKRGKEGAHWRGASEVSAHLRAP